MRFFSRKVKIIEGLVYCGCFTMFLVQVFVSFSEFATYQTIPTVLTSTLSDILFPRILICPKKAWKLRGAKHFELIRGVKNQEDDFVGWSGSEGKSPEEYIKQFATEIDGIYGYITSYENMRHDKKFKLDKQRMNLRKGFCLGKDFTSEEVKNYTTEWTYFRLRLFIQNPKEIDVLMIASKTA